MTPYAPIALFCYNRPKHLTQTLDALEKNTLAHESELFIFSDQAKNEQEQILVDEVRKEIAKPRAFKRIVVTQRQHNYGLALNIIQGVTELINKYGSVIVVEDDLLTSPYFLQFMNKGLQKYRDEPQVGSIHGYIYPIKNKQRIPETFFLRGGDCWGWATWADRWRLFEPNAKKLILQLRQQQLVDEFDLHGAVNNFQMLIDQSQGKNNSWAIRWHASLFLHNKLTLYPRESLVHNIGNDNSGTHSQKTNLYDVHLAEQKIHVEMQQPIVNEQAQFAFQQYFYQQHYVQYLWKKIRLMLVL